MGFIRSIFIITTIVSVLSLALSVNGLETQRINRRAASSRIKRTSYIRPPSVPLDYTNNTNGFYVFNLELIKTKCYSNDDPDCVPGDHKWQISDFKFQLYNKKDPCVDTSIDFYPERLLPIEKNITAAWAINPTYLASEWKGSGSCSLRIPELNNEFKYFKKSVDLFERFNPIRILQDKGIYFGGNYSIESIRGAISNALGGVQPQLGCLGGNDPLNAQRDGIDQFETINIFLNKQFNPINNPGWRKYIFHDCPQNGIVHYAIKDDYYQLTF